jgi:hypothetical protein
MYTNATDHTSLVVNVYADMKDFKTVDTSDPTDTPIFSWAIKDKHYAYKTNFSPEIDIKAGSAITVKCDAPNAYDTYTSGSTTKTTVLPTDLSITILFKATDDTCGEDGSDTL